MPAIALKRRHQPPLDAVITIQNLRLRTFVGFNTDEKRKKQDVVLNIHIVYRMNAAVFEDSVSDALNYRTITKRVIDLIENGRFLLLEKLVADVLAVCSADPSVRRARVSADKPHALRFADSVSVTLEYEAEAGADTPLLEKAS